MRAYTEHMKLQSLRALLAIVEHGSFSEAALELGTSQSAMSYAVAELESELGIRVLERGRFGAVPTEAGRRIVAHARHIEASLETIRQEATLEQGSVSGTLRVSAFRSAATHLLPAVIAELGDRHPDLRIEVREVGARCIDSSRDLREGTVDVALTMPELAGDTVFWTLLRDPYVVVAQQEVPVQEPVVLEALLRQPVILSDGPCSWPMREALLARDPDFEPAYELSEDSTILGLVAQGLGVALMPELTLESFPSDLRRIPLRDPIDRAIGVALLPRSLKGPAVRALLQTLRRRFAGSEIPHLGDRVIEAA